MEMDWHGIEWNGMALERESGNEKCNMVKEI
jgi:hypothetical protein